MYPESNKIKDLVDQAKNILIIQPDNPDGDSLGSSLGLEQIFYKLNKQTLMICGVELPNYLHYIEGWDRVQQELTNSFDLSIIVDTSSSSLIENLTKRVTHQQLASKPLIIIDHHQTEPTIDFATTRLNIPQASASAEVIYELAKQLKWDITLSGKKSLAAAILSDSLGLTTNSVSARTVHIIGEMVEGGVSLAELENARRDTMRKSPEIVHYKGSLLQRIEYYDDNRIAILTIPWSEIEKYSPLYNPAILALDDMRLTTNTLIAVVLKIYPNNKVTGKIRTNFNTPIADKLAETFNGGGHQYASGFKILNSSPIDQIKKQIINRSMELYNATL